MSNQDDLTKKKAAAYLAPEGRAQYIDSSQNTQPTGSGHSARSDLYKSRKQGSFGEDDDTPGGDGKFKSIKQDEAEHIATQTPGAVRVAGVDHRGSLDTGDSFVTSPGMQQTPAATSGQQQADETLVHAFLVDEEADKPPAPQDEQRDAIPSVAAKAVEYKPWYKRAPVLIALALLLAAVIGVVLGVTLRDSGSSSDAETLSPTTSPAPTAIATVSIVIQLAEQPQETGWSLECDGIDIQSVGQGSYAFLPIPVLVPSFRLQTMLEVVAESECVFTITDAGNDGLLGGFFEVYLGDDIGADENRIARAVPLSGSQSVVFVVEPPNGDPNAPSSAPVLPAPTLQPVPTNETCTICPDGSPVPNRDVILVDAGSTCGAMDDLARDLLNSTQCREEFQSLATECGCTNFCDTLCPDGSLIAESQEDTLVRVDNGRPVTCGNIQDQVMILDSSASDCLTASFLGEEICGCPSEGNFCRICEPGGPSRLPTNLSREIIPGIACEDISGIAFSLLTSDPRFSTICPACLSIGAYCGCPEVENPRTFCRLCGGRNLLPVPDRLVFSPTLNQTTTCFHVEFFSNLGITPNGTTSVIPDCSVVQNESADECCTA